MGMFQSDAVLLTLTRVFMNSLGNPFIFRIEFARSMENMGAIGVLTGEFEELQSR